MAGPHGRPVTVRLASVRACVLAIRFLAQRLGVSVLAVDYSVRVGSAA